MTILSWPSIALAAFRRWFEWAKANQTDFYRIYARLLPVESHVGGPDGAAVEIDLVGAKEILMQKLLPELFATDRDIKCKEIAR